MEITDNESGDEASEGNGIDYDSIPISPNLHYASSSASTTADSADHSECSSTEDDFAFDFYQFYYNEDNDNDNDNDNDDEDDEVETTPSNSKLDFPLFEGSKMEVGQFISKFTQISLANKVSQSTMDDYLNLFKEAAPNDNNVPKSLYRLFKMVKKGAPSFTIFKHYYCGKCLHYVNNSEPLSCDNEHCSEIYVDKSNFFFQMDLEEQLRYLFEKQDLSKKLQHLDGSRTNHGCISDMHDGTEYLRVNTRAGRGLYDLTLIMNTDGLSLSKSSRIHVWPLMYQIAELPEHLRDSHTMVLGLWYDGKNKPRMNTFLQPVVDQVKKCFFDGFSWTNPETNEVVTSKVTAPLFIADAPARATIQNIVNFNGCFGCNTCEIETQPCLPIPNKKNVRAYISSECSLRTVETMRNLEKGVKGVAVISQIPLLDMSTCVVPEYMHCVLLGVVKQCLQFWLERDRGGLSSLHNYTNELDQFMNEIRPPISFHRLPRPVSEFKHWKASEFLNWLLYYSLPALQGILHETYLSHWILLVTGVFNLLQRRITLSDLSEAETALGQFVEKFETLYTDRECSYNVHQLTHLGTMVKRWGPLWATSAFPFENVNGVIGKLVHGTKNKGQEIMNWLSKVHCINVQAKRKNVEDFAKGEVNLAAPDANILNEHVGEEESVRIFSKAIINNIEFTSELYKKTKHNSYTVVVGLKSENPEENAYVVVLYGSIRFYFGEEKNFNLVIRKLKVQHTRMFSNVESRVTAKHILPAKLDDVMILKRSDIKWIKHLVPVGEFVCKMPFDHNKIM